MIDEHFDRTYQSGRAALNDGIARGLGRLGRSIGVGLAAMHRLQFSAPWESGSRRNDAGPACPSPLSRAPAMTAVRKSSIAVRRTGVLPRSCR